MGRSKVDAGAAEGGEQLRAAVGLQQSVQRSRDARTQERLLSIIQAAASLRSGKKKEVEPAL